MLGMKDETEGYLSFMFSVHYFDIANFVCIVGLYFDGGNFVYIMGGFIIFKEVVFYFVLILILIVSYPEQPLVIAGILTK